MKIVFSYAPEIKSQSFYHPFGGDAKERAGGRAEVQHDIVMSSSGCFCRIARDQVFRLGSCNHLSDPSFRVSLDITKNHAAKHFHDSAFLKEAACSWFRFVRQHLKSFEDQNWSQ